MSSMKELTVQGDGCLESIHRRRCVMSSWARRICVERARLRVCVWLRVHERARPLFCCVGLGVVADRCPFFLAMQFITPLVVGDLWLCPDAHRTKRCISLSILYQTPESTAGEANKIKKEKENPLRLNLRAYIMSFYKDIQSFFPLHFKQNKRTMHSGIAAQKLDLLFSPARQ